jgi:hypothetical protein
MTTVECQSFLDNVIAQFGSIGAYNNRDGRQIVMGRNGVQAVLVNLQCAGCAQARCRVLVKGVEVTQSTSCPLILMHQFGGIARGRNHQFSCRAF